MRFQELLTCVKPLKIEARRVLDKTIRGDTVGIGRDHACYAPDPTDPRVSEDVDNYVSYETVKT